MLDAGRIEVFVKVRSTRPPRAALLSATAGGYEIELVDGEDGVSPGQACVFYDGAEGQARVLGGGFIRAAARRRARDESGTGFGSDHAQQRLGRWGRRSTATRSRRPTRAGRRSTTWCSAAVFEQGRQASIAAAEAHVGPGGGRILEVGVGTGISLLELQPQQSPGRHRHLGADAAARAGSRRRAPA